MCQDDLQLGEVDVAWIYLFIAGALEVAWAAGLKRLGLGGGWMLGILTLITMAASLLALYAAMARLPLGIAYPIWTGIGSVGSVAVGVLFFNQTIGASTVAGVLLLVAGMVLLGADAH
ncbi:DMT family transporter [Gymnodinialimonas ceratoperidinii]|uniref:Guanidinium exporter n=1 Tax=Gymnodinialimonas ceratoperidinii TaxID=2856823 RepID=A0A8F6YBK3_9RHOB|nr:SMR family transporter [Gymnodinialimonas ceratoperidinii]QXT38272.1 QacE family quaternary ammonium compound efflux SMR transporter [Gymnodinialimonas ceratoperidinii]